MGWTRPILTDSGGFQVMSLAGLVTVDDDGVRYRSHVDGRRGDLRPEDAVAIQEALGGLIAQKARLTLTVAQVLRAGDDLAVLYGNWSGHYTDPDGARVETAGQSVEVVRRQADGSWRFVIDDPFGRG